MTKKTAELKAQIRTETGKEVARQLRAQGRLPAVLYGKELEAIGLSLDMKEVEYLFHRIAVENTIVELYVEGEKEPYQTLIREIQSLPHKPGLLHVDFLRIQKGVAVEVDIPVHLEGVPTGVRDSGGMLEQSINELRVKCIPSLIPETVSIDVSAMVVGDSIHVSDVDLGEGVDILIDAERTICSVHIPKVVEVEVELTEEELLAAEEAEAAAAAEGEGEGAEGEETPGDDEG
ncbi:50S ribosomal protein L25 [Gemmatimonadota bacterium]